MHNYTSSKNFLRSFLFIICAISSSTAVAQIQRTFSPRFSDAVNGDFVMIANNMVSEHATLDYTGTSDNHFLASTYVDIDSDPTTFNSSSANLVNPAPSSACLSIKKAFLYWAAANKEHGVDSSGNLTGNGGTEVNWPSNQVKLMLPGTSIYTMLTADELIYDGRAAHFVNDPYIGIKDITSLVQGTASPYGTYQVANVKATEGDLFSHDDGGNTGTSGGWQIVFIYESPQLKRRNITLFDGYANITQSSNSFDILFDGFQTVPNGPVNANMLIGSLEGDRGISGDQLQILDTNGNWASLSTTQRDANNFFNSKITVKGNQFLDRNPTSTNTLGYDAALFELANNGNQLIDNDQTSATVRMTSNQETYGLYLLGLSVEIFEPSLGALNFTTSVVGATFDPGDTAPVEIRLKNVGNDNIRNLEIALTLPPQVELANTDPLPPGVTYTLDNGTRELRFFVADGYTDVNDPEYALDFNLFVNQECVTCSAVIALQALATFTGETNPAMVGTLSSGTVDACGLGNHDPTYLYVIPVLSITDASGNEGTDLSFGITSSHLLAEDASLNLAYTHQTTTDADYTQLVSFTVPEGTGTTILNIPTIEDLLTESTETFEISIASSDPITILDNKAIGSIIDNDMSVIIVEDYTQEYMLSCGDEIPAVPELTFSGGCGNYQVDFTEIEEPSTTSGDFMIVRTWDVTDSCGNSASFEQIVFIMQLEEVISTITACTADNPIDLISYLPENFDTNGTFTVTQGVATLNRTTLDPADLEPGTYGISYSSTMGRCSYLVQFIIEVNADCVDCNEEDITVSTTVTPNGDGINDVFTVLGGEDCFFIYGVMIFNRWGKKVYQAEDYQNNWAGTSPESSFGSNGLLPAGTYYYIINISNRIDLKPINGYIYLGTK